MKRRIAIGAAFAALYTSPAISQAVESPASVSKPAERAQASERLSVVPSEKPGVFTVQRRGTNKFLLVVSGHKFSARNDIEKYLAYRAAELTKQEKASWFTLIEARTKGDTVPTPERDTTGRRYSFRMEYWRPIWRYKTKDSAAWKSWSPFAGTAFIAESPASITDFQVTAEILLHRDKMDYANPLAFEAGALSDFLTIQISPPE